VPSPSKAAVAMAVAAGVMALLGEMGGREKLAWIFLLLGFLVVEFKAIDKDRTDAEVERKEARNIELTGFSAVARGINHSIDLSRDQFGQTMNRSDRIIAGVGDTIKAQTGGDSFAYVTFTPQPNQQFLIAVASHGKYPLRQIHVTLVDDERRLQAMQEFNKHPEGNWIAAIQAGDTEFQIPYLRPQSPEAPGGDVEMLGSYPFGAKDINNFTVVFSSLNGYWNQRLHLRRVDGNWHQALSVVGPTAKQMLHPFIYFDPDYPEGKALAEKDWRPVRAPKPLRPIPQQ
jgi:hypothetical protein